MQGPAFVFLFSALTIIASCSNESMVDTIRNSTLNFDRTITIGQAFDSYPFFKEKRYEELVDNKGRKVVRFTGVLTSEFDSYVQQCVWDAKRAMPEQGSVQHALKITDLIWKNRNALEICDKQWKFNDVELARIVKRAAIVEDCQAIIAVDFSRSVDTKEVFIVNKNIMISKESNGKVEMVEPDCDDKVVSEKILIGIYKNEDPFDNAKECFVKYKIKPCSLEE